MEKHLLLTIGDHQSTSSSLRFLKNFFNGDHPFKLTLFYVSPRSGGFCADRDSDHDHPKAQQALEQARHELVDRLGFAADDIDAKSVTAARGTVGDIISEARDGLYDAVIMGRRGLSRFEELFESSVSHSILWESIDFPIWVCRKPLAPERHNVLLCVDGSGESIRMADHVGFMLAEQPRHSVTLFHVEDEGLDQAFVERWFDEAREALAVNGVSKDRIHQKTKKSGNIVKTVLKEGEEGGYGVIAAGRRNRSSSAGKIFFPGSVTSGLLRRTENCALWVSK